MIFRWRFAGLDSRGEALYDAADAATRKAARLRFGGARDLTRVYLHDASRREDRHAFPSPGLTGEPPAPEIACNRCNLGRPARVAPCPICRCPEYRLITSTGDHQ